MKAFVKLLLSTPLTVGRVATSRSGLTQRRVLVSFVALVFISACICGSQQAIAQGLASGARINGALPRYNSSVAGMNHVILGIDQVENNELDTARMNFVFVINLKDDAPAMGGMKLKPVAYLNLGVVDSLEGNSNGAINNYLKAIELKPDYTEAYFNLGALYYKLGTTKKAEEAFLKAIDLDPGYGRAHYSLGFLYLEQGKLDLAKLHADKAEESGVPFRTLKDRLAKLGRNR